MRPQPFSSPFHRGWHGVFEEKTAKIYFLLVKLKNQYSLKNIKIDQKTNLNKLKPTVHHRHCSAVITNIRAAFRAV